MARFNLFGKLGKVLKSGTTFSGDSISIVGRRIIIDGKVVSEDAEGVVELRILDGIVKDVRSDMNVTCEEVRGNVEAGMNVRCGNIGGNAEANMTLNCGDIAGKARAGMNITAKTIHGDADAGMTIRVK